MLAKVIKKVFDAKYFNQSTRIDLKKQQNVNVGRGSMNMFFWWDCIDCHWKFCLVGQSSSPIVNQDCVDMACVFWIAQR
jgi:hypothetical protein